VVQWVPLYETTLEAVQTELATFFEAFPHGTVWSNDVDGEGYDMVILGQLGDTTIDADALQARLDREDHARVAESLRNVEFRGALDLLLTYSGRAEDLREWLARAEVNRDRNLRLQYLAGLGLNRYEADSIFQSLVSYRRFPEKLFPVTGAVGARLKSTFE
jgi:spermidine synthase